MGTQLLQSWPLVVVAVAILAVGYTHKVHGRKEFERIFGFSPAPMTEPGARENHYVLGMLSHIENEVKKAESRLREIKRDNGPYTYEDSLEHWSLHLELVQKKLKIAQRLATRFGYRVNGSEQSNSQTAAVA